MFRGLYIYIYFLNTYKSSFWKLLRFPRNTVVTEACVLLLPATRWPHKPWNSPHQSKTNTVLSSHYKENTINTIQLQRQLVGKACQVKNNSFKMIRKWIRMISFEKTGMCLDRCLIYYLACHLKIDPDPVHTQSRSTKTFNSRCSEAFWMTEHYKCVTSVNETECEVSNSKALSQILPHTWAHSAKRMVVRPPLKQKWHLRLLTVWES